MGVGVGDGQTPLVLLTHWGALFKEEEQCGRIHCSPIIDDTGVQTEGQSLELKGLQK